MLYLTVMLTLVGLAACVLDHKLEAKYQTMPHSEFIDYFNDQNYSWVMTQYPENIIINFNLQLNTKSDHELPTKIHDPEVIGDLPENFDARIKWPHCKTIKEIYNQQNCDSCWAHGVANTASDRICIKHGTEIRLSEQDLECSHPHQTICHSGSAVNGFLFWKNTGLVPRDCKPYDPLDVNRNKCVRFCQYDPILGNYLQKKFFAEEVYSIRNDSYQIKAELVINGPVQAAMPLYSDFRSGDFGYKGGIYEHKYGELLGYHSVRVIGYGVENGVEYWLVANSWGPCWGEKGLFRIKAFQEDMHFEEFILAGIPR